MLRSKRLGNGVLLSALLAASQCMLIVPARAQVTAVSPFTGTLTETWEGFPNYQNNGFNPLSNPTPILGGFARIFNPGLFIYEPGTVDASLGLSGFAQTSDGVKGLQVGSDDPLTTIKFASPVTKFGAYWGAQTFGGATTIDLEFFNASHKSFATLSFDYNHEESGDGGLDWHGWTSTTPFSSLTFTGNQVAIDGLQSVPEPGVVGLFTALCVSGSVFLSGRKRPARQLAQTTTGV